MEILLLSLPDGNVIARGSYFGGPDYEFFVAADGQVYFRVVGDAENVWAGPDPESFRQIVMVWQAYQTDISITVAEMRQRLTLLGALPNNRPPDPETLWSMLLSEAYDV